MRPQNLLLRPLRLLPRRLRRLLWLLRPQQRQLDRLRWLKAAQRLLQAPHLCRLERQLLPSQLPKQSLVKRARMVPWETLALQDLQDQRDGLDPLVQTQL